MLLGGWKALRTTAYMNGPDSGSFGVSAYRTVEIFYTKEGRVSTSGNLFRTGADSAFDVWIGSDSVDSKHVEGYAMVGTQLCEHYLNPGSPTGGSYHILMCTNESICNLFINGALTAIAPAGTNYDLEFNRVRLGTLPMYFAAALNVKVHYINYFARDMSSRYAEFYANRFNRSWCKEPMYCSYHGDVYGSYMLDRSGNNRSAEYAGGWCFTPDIFDVSEW